MGLFDEQAKAPAPRPAEAAPERPAPASFGVKIEFTTTGEGVDAPASMFAGQVREYEFAVRNSGTEDDRIKIAVLPNYDPSDSPEWGIKLWGVEESLWDVTFSKTTEKQFVLIGGGSREDIILQVTCPKGARYGDKLALILRATSAGDPAKYDEKAISATARQALVAVKTSIGHERTVADAVFARAKARDIGVFSILVPTNLRGYIFVESMNPDRLEEVARGIRRARGIVKDLKKESAASGGRGGRGKAAPPVEEVKVIQYKEIEMYLAPKPVVSGIMEGDIVELMAGPFKGEKARVMKIDETKEEVTVELFEAMVRIPVTVPGTSVRVLQKEEEK